MRMLAVVVLIVAGATPASPLLEARQGGRGQGAGRGQAPTPRAAAPIDLTGVWVSLVTDDWRWRMVTPPKGDVLYLPVNAEARKVADAWDPARDEAAGEQCKGYGAPGVMALPGRLRISWESDTTLKIEIDTGQQTRLLHFAGSTATSGEPSWQGYSEATWELPGGGRGRRGAGAPRSGSLKVVTTNLRPGYFRKNGVPYGAGAVLTEYVALLNEASGDQYLAITRTLEDARYLTGPFIRTIQFKRQRDETGWNPMPCSAR
ncbi:MAG: hypothetical protein HY657_12740 [Acidobacteria bacterium]|nr:hypothetical protein [Acidobacteriota bacterium]